MDVFRILFEDPAIRDSIRLTLQVAGLTLVIQVLLGLGLGYLLALCRWPGRWLLDALVTLPLIFPPVATGFVLLSLLGRRGWLGSWLNDWGGEVVFSFWGVLLASVVAGLPLVVKPVQAALAGVSERLGEAARVLGKSEWTIFCRVFLPNIQLALGTGLLMALGRSLGEVGITLMLGGNISGRTTTVSLAVYNAVMDGAFEQAALLSLLLGGVSLLLFAALKRLGRFEALGARR